MSCETATYFYDTFLTKKGRDAEQYHTLFETLRGLMPFERLVGDEFLFQWMLLQKTSIILTTRDDLALQYEVLRHNKSGFSTLTCFGAECLSDCDFYLASSLLDSSSESAASVKLFGSPLFCLTLHSVMQRFSRLGLPIQKNAEEKNVLKSISQSNSHCNAGFQNNFLWMNTVSESSKCTVATLRYMALLGYDTRDISLFTFSDASAQHLESELLRQARDDPWYQSLINQPILVASSQTLPLCLDCNTFVYLMRTEQFTQMDPQIH